MPPKRGVGRAAQQHVPAPCTWRTPSGAPATPAFLRQLQDSAVDWWAVHQRRDLPWRPYMEDFTQARYDPYQVWVSEVMSQQTRMDTVLGYFPCWVAAFPTVERLSAATEDEVRRVWAGMGFYRRALYLRRGAQYIVEQHRAEHQGAQAPVRMPGTYTALLKVPGIGPYTAAAIASVCYGEPVASVDGNLIRVLSRLRAEPDVDPKNSSHIKAAMAWGQELMLGDGSVCPHPGALNQGLMEIGAAICRPGGPPLCNQCPLHAHCGALARLTEGNIPAIDGVIPQRGSKTKMREDSVVCVVHELVGGATVTAAGETAPRQFVVVKRPESGLLGGMLEFPCLTFSSRPVTEDKKAVPAATTATRKPSPEEEQALAKLSLAKGGKSADGLTRVSVGTVRHVFSHIDMLVHVYHAQWTQDASAAEQGSLCGGVAGVLDAEAGAAGEPADPADERVSIMTEDQLTAAAPSRLCLKILHLVHPRKRTSTATRAKKGDTHTPPAKAARA